MNIIYHHRTRGTGAEGIHIREIFRAFKRNGHNVKMVSLTNKSVIEKDPTSEGAYEYSYTKEFVVRMSRKIFALLYNIPGTLSLLKESNKQTNFIYERYSLYNLAGILVSMIRKIPLVLEVNAPYAYEVEEHEKPLFPNLAKKVEILIFNKSFKIVVISESLKNYLCSLGISEQKIIVMHNGVDFTAFDVDIQGERVRQRYLLQNKIIVGFIGGLEPHHGLIKLIDALKNLNVKVSLMLVGSGSLERELKKRAKDYGLDAIFTGRIPHEEIPEHIAAMDICIKPDANPYCSPMKIFEYMAMKKPIIAGDTPSIREILNDDLAFLIEPTEDKIREAIEMVVNNPELSETISKNAYDYVRRNFSWDKNANTVIDIISKPNASDWS